MDTSVNHRTAEEIDNVLPWVRFLFFSATTAGLNDDQEALSVSHGAIHSSLRRPLWLFPVTEIRNVTSLPAAMHRLYVDMPHVSDNSGRQAGPAMAKQLHAIDNDIQHDAARDNCSRHPFSRAPWPCPLPSIDYRSASRAWQSMSRSGDYG